LGDGPYAQRDAVGESYRRFKADGVPEALAVEARDWIAHVASATGRAAHLPPSGNAWGIPFGSGTIAGWLHGFKDRRSPGFVNDYTYIPAGEKALILASRMARKWAMSVVSPFEKPAAFDHPFVLFGFHMQPEASTLVRGQFHQDMAAVAENLARSLPGRFQLVVKDHDIMFGHRPRAFYQRLSRVPNIRLVSPYLSGPDLIRKAAGVAVISGSMGWDSVQLGIPTLVVGEAFYRDYAGLEYQPDPSQWPAAFDRLLNQWTLDSDDRLAVVAAVLENALPIDMDKMRHLKKGMAYADAKNMAAALAERVR